MTESSATRLTVAMIVRNEANQIVQALQGVMPAADEVIVVDTGSEDDTRHLALQQGARVIDFAWSDDFSAARNRAIEAATGDWILWIDAGERLPFADAGKLRAFVANEANPVCGYLVWVQVPAAGPQESAFHIAQPRLVPRMMNLQFERPVRETLRPAINRTGMQAEVSPFSLHRSSIEHDRDRVLARCQRNLRIAGQAADSQGLAPWLLLTMGDAHEVMGETEKAHGYFQTALQRSAPNSTERLQAYYGALSTVSLNQQLALAAEAIDEYPLDAPLLCLVGSRLQDTGRLDLAARAFETAVVHGQCNPETWQPVNLAENATLSLSLLFERTGAPEGAVKVLEQALTHEPSERIRMGLVELHIHHGHKDAARSEVEKLPHGNIREAFRRKLKS